MKKNIIILLAGVMMLSSCFYGGSATANGAYFGSVLGSAIGGITGGHRGHDIGTIVGMAAGAAVGAGIDRAAIAEAREDQRQYLEEKARLRARREARQQSGSGYVAGAGYQQNAVGSKSAQGFTFEDGDDQDSGFDANGGGDDRIDIDFDAPAEYPAETSGVTASAFAAPALEVREMRFVDADGDGVISRGEQCEIVVEIFNAGDADAINVEPIVVTVDGQKKHILVSPTILVESIRAHRGVRYTARVVADRMLKSGDVTFSVALNQNGSVAVAPQTFTIKTTK